MDIFGADRRPALKRIDRPTLVIASGESPLLDVQKEMAERIPGARWVVVSDYKGNGGESGILSIRNGYPSAFSAHYR
jgi:hypothetical protein